MAARRRAAKAIGAGATSAALLAGGVAAATTMHHAALHESANRQVSVAARPHARVPERAGRDAPHAISLVAQRTGNPTHMAVARSFGAPFAAGRVQSVNGSSAAGSCGTAGAAGSFTVGNPKTGAVTTVDVTATTKFADPVVTTNANFADVCVGDMAGATGTRGATSSATLTADVVYVQPPKPAGARPPFAAGRVQSVNGSSTAGSCGTAGAAGSFTVTRPWGTGVVTVDVTAATTFVDPSTTGATFATVCVGDPVAVRGTTATGTLTATVVYTGRLGPARPVSRPFSPKPPWSDRVGPFWRRDPASGGRPSGDPVQAPTASQPGETRASNGPQTAAPSPSPAPNAGEPSASATQANGSSGSAWQAGGSRGGSPGQQGQHDGPQGGSPSASNGGGQWGGGSHSGEQQAAGQYGGGGRG